MAKLGGAIILQVNETSYIKSVHRHLSSDVYRWKINDRFTNGVPDAWYCGKTGSLWVEYKYVQLPARDDTLVRANLSKNQLQWLLQRQCDGQNVAVVVGSSFGGYWTDEIERVYDGVACEYFKRLMLPPRDIAGRINFVVTSEY